MATAIRQASFAGGEVAPVLHGRSDFDRYASALATCRNFFISRHGAAVSRPGLQYLGGTKDNQQARLIPFIVADDDACVLELTPSAIRIWRDGELVTSGGSPIEIVTPYTASDLPRIQYAQTGDMLILTHPRHEARELVRSSPTTWSLRTVSFASGITGLGYNVVLDGAEPAPTQDFPARRWDVLWTVVYREDATGIVREGGAQFVALSDELAIYPGQPLRLKIGEDMGTDPSLVGATIVETRFYRGRDGVYGYVGRIQGAQVPGATFVDEGDEPDYTRQVPLNTRPFDPYEMPPFQKHPAAVGFFEGRLVFGATTERPATLWCSRTDSYFNFDQPVPAVATNAVEITLASRRREEIRSILGLDRLLVFTSSSVWSVGGSNGGPLSATDLPEARVQQEIGCSHVPPLVVDGSALYLRAKGHGVRDLFYDESRRGYGSADLSVLAEHLFQLDIIDWTYAEDPWSLVWAVRRDGRLLSLTYSREHQVWAWAQHQTAGVVQSVCAIPEGGEDVVYVAVQRTVGIQSRHYIERLTQRTRAADAICLDSHKTFTVPPWFSGGNYTFTGLGHLEGKMVHAVIDGRVFGPAEVDAGAVTFWVDKAPGSIATMTAHVGLAYTCDLETLDLAEARSRQKRVVQVEWEVLDSRGFWTGPDFDNLTEWRQRKVADSYSAVPLFTGRVQMAIRSGYETGGRVVLRQIDPLPITVLGVTRDVDAGG